MITLFSPGNQKVSRVNDGAIRFRIGSMAKLLMAAIAGQASAQDAHFATNKKNYADA
jgi:hypothetical protein